MIPSVLYTRRGEGGKFSRPKERDGVESLNTRRGRAPKNNRRFKFGSALFLAGLVLLSIALVTLILAAPGSPAGEVTAGPSEVYTGDDLAISIQGFPADYPVPAGSVTLGGVRLPIPGVFGVPGVKPVTDSLGDVTFTVQVPLDVPFWMYPLALRP